MLLLLILGLPAAFSCRPGPDLPRAFALTLRDDQLHWEVSAGCLNDRDFPAIEPATFRAVAAPVERLLGTVPGLSVRFIPDQPMDAQFIMERTAPRQRKAAIRAARDGLLDLSADADNSAVWARLGASPAVRESRETWRAARRLRSANGQPFFYDKLPSSDFAWRAFLRDQGRYDLVLTNAFLFPDDLRHKRLPDERDRLGGVRTRIAAAEGRPSLEGWAVVLSANEEVQGGGQPDTQELARRTAAALLAVLVGIPLPLAQKWADNAGEGRTLFAGCSGCAELWDQRRHMLRAWVRARDLERQAACREIAPVREGSAAWSLLDPDRLPGMSASVRRLRSFCGLSSAPGEKE